MKRHYNFTVANGMLVKAKATLMIVMKTRNTSI
jgi:hypothetical protein